jgi:hypothetical protein
MGDPIELEFLHAHGAVCALFGYADVTITVWHGSGNEPAVHPASFDAAMQRARILESAAAEGAPNAPLRGRRSR